MTTNELRYTAACIKAFLDSRQITEPLGARFGLDLQDAEDIAATVHKALTKTSATPNPRWEPHSAGMLNRLRRAYEKQHLSVAGPWWDAQEARFQ